MQKLEAQRIEPKSGDAPKKMVILLHGLGADAQDLISLAPYWEKDLTNTVFVAPNAPFKCDMSPFGYQWFSVQDRSPEAMLKWVEQAYPILNNFIDEELKEYNLTDDDVVLSGFSQGAMMTFYTGPRRENAMAGLIGYSGALWGGEDLSNDNIVKSPILMIHGDADDVVLPHSLRDAKSGFEKAGFYVQDHLRSGLGHGIDEFGLTSGLKFIKTVF